MATLAEARQKKDLFKQLYLSADRAPYVNGCGITSDTKGVFVIKVNLKSALPKGFDLPHEFEGILIISEVVGTLSARS